MLAQSNYIQGPAVLPYHVKGHPYILREEGEIADSLDECFSQNREDQCAAEAAPFVEKGEAAAKVFFPQLAIPLET